MRSEVSVNPMEEVCVEAVMVFEDLYCQVTLKRDKWKEERWSKAANWFDTSGANKAEMGIPSYYMDAGALWSWDETRGAQGRPGETISVPPHLSIPLLLRWLILILYVKLCRTWLLLIPASPRLACRRSRDRLQRFFQAFLVHDQVMPSIRGVVLTPTKLGW